MEDIFDYIKEILDKGDTLLIEEKIVGKEFSFTSLTDGNTITHTKPIHNYKRLNVNNTGPNTSSMGCTMDNCTNSLCFLKNSYIEVEKWLFKLGKIVNQKKPNLFTRNEAKFINKK